MLFDSFSFLIFFPIVFVVYYSLPHFMRPALLLLASCVFYMAFVPQYILIMFAVITLDYFLAQLIQDQSGPKRTWYLWMSITANLGILFVFKYFNFFNANVGILANALHWNYPLGVLSIALPLGLSFHVFQSLSYVIEVYRGKFVPEKNYLIYALYVLFFPQLVAGPIERPAHLLPQFRVEHPFSQSAVVLGLERMLWGFFKKLVIADNLAPIVDHIYTSGTSDGPALILALTLFAYQLYCDFSGYSDIAVGAAQVLGFEITENFNRPYAGKTVQEFWQRWHISLSSWLRDYLYYPLALSGKHHSQFRLYSSLFITFVLIGLWHGANWTFVIMGAVFGFYLIFGSITAPFRKGLRDILGVSKRPGLQHAIQVACTFILVSIAWVFFRAADLGQAWHILSNLDNGITSIFSFNYLWHTLFTFSSLGPVTKSSLALYFSAMLLMEIIQHYQEKLKTMAVWSLLPSHLRYIWAYSLIAAILLIGHLGAQPFIYFQF